MTSVSSFFLTGSSLPYTSPIPFLSVIICLKSTFIFTNQTCYCHRKIIPDHISNSFTFPGLQNSLKIPGLWQPCYFFRETAATSHDILFCMLQTILLSPYSIFSRHICMMSINVNFNSCGLLLLCCQAGSDPIILRRYLRQGLLPAVCPSGH